VDAEIFWVHGIGQVCRNYNNSKKQARSIPVQKISRFSKLNDGRELGCGGQTLQMMHFTVVAKRVGSVYSTYNFYE
jgi:hypothetical protein